MENKTIGERKEFTDEELRQIPVVKGELLDAETLQNIAGGKKNIDPNTGEYIADFNKMKDWFNTVRNKTYKTICPYCGWYMFWYNRLYCYRRKVWGEELS